MSRGHGRLQREIIALMMELNGAVTIGDLCGIIYHKEGASQKVAVRRALKRLAAEKLVKSSSFASSGHPCWVFLGTNADRTGERLQKLRARERVRRKPTLVEG